MNKKYLVFCFPFINILLFILGNYIYTTNSILILKVLISEGSFILIYILTDKGNIEYGFKFAITNIILILQFYTPLYSGLFYSYSVQLFSVSIFIFSVTINCFVVTKLVSKGLKRILSSRIATTCASAIEICCFAILLEIGIKGALLTAITRIFYILTISRIVFRKT